VNLVPGTTRNPLDLASLPACACLCCVSEHGYIATFDRLAAHERAVEGTEA
jgi:hypothetical protein